MSPGVGRVDQHNVEIARQPAMLEAVIEYEDLALQFLDRDTGEGDTVGSLQMGHIGTVLFQYQRLVIGAMLSAMAATEDGDIQLPLPKKTSDILDAGRLAGAADGQVADADDRH